MAQPQVMLHGWFPLSCIFQGLTSGSQGLPASCSSALGHIAKVPFLGEYLSLQVCMIIRKLVKVEQHRSVLAVSRVCAAQLLRRGYRQAQALTRQQGRKERAWANVKLRGSHSFIQFKLETSCFSSEPLKYFVSGIKQPGHVWNNSFRTMQFPKIFCNLTFWPDCG